MHSLPVFLRLTGRPVILIGDGEAAASKRVLLERAGAQIVGEGAAAALAIVAVEDDGEARAAIARLKARGILVNATDRADACDFTLPAIIDRDPVIVAIGTGGASAGLAKALRQRLERLLPSTLGPLASALQSARNALRVRYPDAADRRRAIDDALEEGGALDLFGHVSDETVTRWLADEEEANPAQAVTITLVSSDPDDMTLAQARALSRADRVIHDPDVPPAILARARADAVRIEGEERPEPLPQGVTVLVRLSSVRPEELLKR